MDKSKKEAIAKLIAVIFGTIFGGFILYWGFSLIFWVIKYAFEG